MNFNDFPHFLKWLTFKTKGHHLPAMINSKNKFVQWGGGSSELFKGGVSGGVPPQLYTNYCTIIYYTLG